jgi:hypothetical protein
LFYFKVIKEWFYNRGRKNAIKDRVTYVKKWTLKKVVGHVLKAEVDETCRDQTDAPPGAQEYIAGYQTALKQVVDGLSAADKEEYLQMAQQWTDQSPPAEVQRK